MKTVLKYLVLFMAISLAAIVAYVSISGLLLIFSGVGLIGLIFFSSIELSKIVATSAIHTYSNILNWGYKTLLSLGIIIAMAITSMGVYGFLSSAYKSTSLELTSINAELGLIDTKLDNLKDNKLILTNQLIQSQEGINELRNALSNNKQVWVDANGNQVITSSSANRKVLETQLTIATSDVRNLQQEITLIDSTFNHLYNEKLVIETNNTVASELGPLLYLSGVFDTDMDTVMKWFILLLIVIGDPMAVLLIIIFNKIANQTNNSTNNSLIPNDDTSKVEPVVLNGNEVELTSTTSTENNLTHDSIIEQLPSIDTSESKVESDNTNNISLVEPVTPRKKITINDIPEIKSKRGFSVDVPNRRGLNQISKINNDKNR